jgi:hypothetical protein
MREIYICYKNLAHFSIKKVNPMVLAIGGVAVVILIYEAQQKGLFSKLGLGGGGSAPAGQAANVNFVLTPPSVQPNSSITVTGQFTDAGGKAISVPQGLWYIYERTNVNTPILMQQGKLGTNVSNFTQQIQTTNFPEGTYSFVVADQPFSMPSQPATTQGLGSAGVYNAAPTGALTPTLSTYGQLSLS